jgi:hypothetical protein
MKEYIDDNDKKHEHIYFINNTEWYFGNEVQQLEGPYKTLEECEKEFKEYCEKYLS